VIIKSARAGIGMEATRKKGPDILRQKTLKKKKKNPSSGERGYLGKKRQKEVPEGETKKGGMNKGPDAKDCSHRKIDSAKKQTWRTHLKPAWNTLRKEID